MNTEFVKNYKDVIVVYDYNEQDYDLLRKAGYEPNDEGGIEVEMVFGDGIAYDTEMNGIVMHYPILAEVEKSAEMQRQIWQTTCRDDIIPYDVALAYGRVGRYKYVLNYDEWIAKDDNDLKEIWCLNKHVEQGDDHAMDVFEDEFYAMDDKGMISCKEDEDGYYIGGNPTQAEIERLQAEYGILWTEWVGTHIYNERGFLEKVA